MTSAACPSFSAAWYSPSAAMIFDRRSRSASACFAMARRISSGRSTCFTSTAVTFTPHGSVWRSMISWSCRLILSRWLSRSSSSTWPRTERRLRELARREEEVGHLQEGAVRLHDAEVDDRVHLHGDVVAGDDVLRRHLLRRDAHVDDDHPVDERDDPLEPGAADAGEPPEAEHDALLVLVHDPDAGQEPEDDEGDGDEQAESDDGHGLPPEGDVPF